MRKAGYSHSSDSPIVKGGRAHHASRRRTPSGSTAQVAQVEPMSKETATVAGPRLPAGVIRKLRCPACRSKLQLDRDRCCCQAPACRREFPVKSGAPILIDHRLSVFGECVQRESNPPRRGPAATAKRLAGALLPSLGRNIGAKQAYAKFAEMLLAISTKPKVLVVGGARVGTASTRFCSVKRSISSSPTCT